MKLKKIPTPTLITIGLIALLTIAYTLWMSMSYPAEDDWVYLHSRGRTFKQFWFCTQGYVSSLPDALQQCYYHYIHSNGRLTDKLLILCQLLPRPFSVAIVAVAFTAMIAMMVKLCCGRKPFSCPGLAGATMLLTLLLPWQDNFDAMAIEFNYIIPSAACLAFCYTFFTTRRVPLYLAMPLALFAGLLHEAFSSAICGGIAIWWLANRCRASRRQYCIGFSFIAGAIAIYLTTGLQSRIHEVPVGMLLLEYAKYVLYDIAQYPALWVLIAACLYHAFKHGLRSLLKALHAQIFWLGAALIGISIILLTFRIGRASWVAELMLLISGLRIAWNSRTSDLTGFRKWIGILAGALSIVWMTAIAFTQAGFTAQTKKVRHAFETQGGGVIFCDVDTYNDQNTWLLRIPKPILREDVYDVIAMGVSLTDGKTPNGFMVLPTELQGKHYTQWHTPDSVIYGAFPFYYLPTASSIDSLYYFNMKFDIGSAPLTPYNLLRKIKAARSHNPICEYNYSIDILRIPSSRLTPAQRRMLTPKGQDTLPEKITYIYIDDVNRSSIGARPLE